MFPETLAACACFPNVSQLCHTGSIVSSVNFCFQKAKFASATRQKHSVFPRGMETWEIKETLMETCFLVLPGLYGIAVTATLAKQISVEYRLFWRFCKNRLCC